ncbi:MAG: type V toxin-antitoxin system endoribonuclease antitoxin GhoS [Patescibacteria group bacterium]
MNSYFTRIELHNAIYATDYNTLHTAMKNCGFIRTIIGNNGRSYNLPTAEYMTTAMSKDDVYNAAKSAANTTGKTSSILVLKYSDWCGDLPLAQ